MITTNRAHGGSFYVHADDPAGPWSEPVRVAIDGIDPSLTFGPDGRVFVHSSRHVLHEIDIATGELLGQGRPIWSGTGGAYPEAPHLYAIGDWWYLLLAEGGTEYGHMVTIARSRDPDGPVRTVPAQPDSLAPQPASSRHPGDGPRRPRPRTHEGRWWIVFLGVRSHGHPPMHHLGRETFLAPVTWLTDGWPVVNDGRARRAGDGRRRP